MRNLLVLLIVASIITGCVTTSTRNLSKISLDMTKKEVIEIILINN